MESNTSKHSVSSTLYDVQFSKSNHPSCKKILIDIYKKSNVDDFLSEFVQCLKVCVMHREKSANVERTLDFAADFAVSFTSDLNDDETCPLLEGVFQFIFDNHDCHIQIVRLRICQLMNRLLDNMGHDATVVEETYNKIAESMLVRLQDSMSSVRTQAVYALHRLQSPNDPKCDIIQAFIYHMTHDPSHEVRRAVIQKIAVNKMTLASILTRMNDVKDSVRKEAYTIISKFLIRQFTIKQRQLILESGLGDRSEMAREYVIEVLVPNWLKYFNYNYYEFLECIHVEKIPETGIKLLKAIFAKQHDVILESRLKDMWIINHKIPYEKLNIITVIYWRSLAEYVKPTTDDDKFEHIFELILPDLTPFCNYIRGYFFPAKAAEQPSTNDTEQITENSEHNENSQSLPEDNKSINQSESQNETENSQSATNDSSEQDKQDEAKNDESENTKLSEGCHTPEEVVLVHLLEMCKVYDLADEMGRSNLKQLCAELLQSPVVTLQSIPVLASLLDYVIPSISTKLSVMAEIITELREPLQATENSVYVPDLLLVEAEEKKAELGEKITDLETEMEIAVEIGDNARVEEIKQLKTNLEEELKIMCSVTPHEPGRNMNNDPDTLKKCMTIVVQIMNKGKITKMNPTLYSLMQNFIIPTLKIKVDRDSSIIKNLALQALGIFCLLDVELAKEHFMMFCFNIANEMLSVTALKCVFDLLHVYGLGTFNIEDPEGSITETAEEGESQKPNLVVLLMSLLTSDSPEMRRTAVIGLCKLLFAGRIKSYDLVTKLIMLWYDPAVEYDPHIRQPLGVFFRLFSSSCPHAPPLLMKAFMPTILKFFKLEVMDPMMEVEVESVASLFIEITRPNYNSHANKEQSIHNQMAIQICEEILSEEHESPNCIFFVKLLSQLELNYDLTTDIAILSALVARIAQTVSKTDKAMARLVTKFETILKIQQENNKTVSTVDNTLPAEATIKSNSTGHSSHFLLMSKDGSGSESDAELEDEELSQDETILQLTNLTEDIVIPGTPETSDSELEDVFIDLNPPLVKSAKISEASDMKELSTRTLRTPAKTPFKIPTKTPRKATIKTPAKIQSMTTSSTNNVNLDISTVQESAMTPAKNTRRATKTPAKNSERTPAKTSAKTPAKTSAKTPAKPGTKTPENTSVSNSPRVTRSSRKRKS